MGKKMSKKVALIRLEDSIVQIGFLRALTYNDPQFGRWHRDTRKLLEHIFDVGSTQVQEFESIQYSASASDLPTLMRESQIAHAATLPRFKALLQSLATELERYGDDDPSEQTQRTLDFWDTIHPEVCRIARGRFESGHYADSVEAAFKMINSVIKGRVLNLHGRELDGAGLMTTAFSPTAPILKLGDLTTETGRSLQQGYMQIFAGSMTGIRNPKAHDNVIIDSTRAIHLIFLASLLMYKIDDCTE